MRNQLVLLHRHVMARPATFLLVAGALGIALRLAWILFRGGGNAGEAQHIAIAWAEGKGWADAYFRGSGPTAHLLPTTPLLAGIVYRLLGIRSVASETVLQGLVFLEIALAITFFHRLFKLLGASQPARLYGAGFLIGIPLFMGQETLDFRYWEGALAIVLAGAGLFHAVRLSAQPGALSKWQILRACLLFSIAFFVNAPIGLAIGLCYFVIMVRALDPKTIATAALILPVTLGVVFAPWTVRNYAVMGEFIPLRSNFGLELAIANNDLAARDGGRDAWRRNMEVLHPINGGAAARRYSELGELRFMEEQKAISTDWIARNPGSFLQLSARHFRQMIFPGGWQFSMGSDRLSPIRSLLVCSIAILALAGLFTRLRAGRPGWWCIAVYLLTLALAYAPFQPMARYLYLAYPVLLFCAADAIARLLARVNWGDRARTSPPSDAAAPQPG